ncbi:MAG: phosphodiesterase [Rhizobiaceae bacterium]|nr:phosphodiesterase [Rhizobiaceae bacterium]
MTKIIVFTDIHFCVEHLDHEINPVTRLEDGLRHALKYNADADHIIITGDLTHKGGIGSYELLKQSLEKFDVSFELMIGNHDHRENFLSVFPETPVSENGHVQRIIDTDTHRLILLDTLDGPPYDYPLSHRGMLCEKRLAWLDEQLASAGNLPVVIFMHHHPHDVGFRAMDTIQLVNSDEFYAVLARHKNVQHISCGHVHRTISGSHRGIPFSVFKSTVGQMPMIFNSMDFHAETNEPPAYGIINLGMHGVTVHTEDYGLTDLDVFL